MVTADDKREDITYRKLLDDIMSRAHEGQRSVRSQYRIVPNPDEWKSPGSLFHILGLSNESLSEIAAATLELHEHKREETPESFDWDDLKWKATAYYELQDIFDAPLFAIKGSPLNLFHLWYFYFESRHLLTESILCGLHGLYTASNAVLRIFLEFNILQLYYYRVSLETQSYRALEDYFDTQRHPSWHTALQKVVPNDDFCRPIKMRLDLHLKSLSKSAVHPYHPDFSPRQHTDYAAQPSLEGIFFWQLARVVLQPVLWAYYVNFPMLFHPRDVLKKFGFGGPVGLFVSKMCATAVKRSLEKDDYQEFLEYTRKDGNVESLTSWYDEQPDLSEEDIEQTWNTKEDGELKRIFPEGYAHHMAKIRSLREIMALKIPEKNNNTEDDRDYNRFLSYTRWKKIYKRLSK